MRLTTAAREQCRTHLRARRNFAFNATNITRQMRQRWIELFVDYDARIEVVYLEPPIATILNQNRGICPKVYPGSASMRTSRLAHRRITGPG
jgi:predicted kinase